MQSLTSNSITLIVVPSTFDSLVAVGARLFHPTPPQSLPLLYYYSVGQSHRLERAPAHTLRTRMLSDMKNGATTNPSIASNGSSSSSNPLIASNGSSSSCSLKRKRPPKIEIPNVLREIPIDPTKHHLSTPRGFSDDAICSSGFGVGLYSIKGKKFSMEDTHNIVSCPDGNKGFFGVYDGHGGSKAAQFVAENLHANIRDMLDKCSENSGKEEAVKAGFLKTDQDFLNQGLGSGTCCVTALFEEKELVISNVGDCRAVLCRGGVAEALTKDHRASLADERKRIENKGGYVEMHRGAWRVHGVLSVSRSIGDAHLKDWVLAEPDTKILCLTSDMEYLVLASDGLWEEVGNQEAVDIVMRSCLVEKKLGANTDAENVNNDEFGCISTSPSPKLRSCLVEKKLGANTDAENVNNDEFGCISTSPSPKLRRVSLVKQKKRMGQSPGCRKRINCWKENVNDFGSENESPPHKAQRISLVNQMKMKQQTPNQENSISKKKPTSGGLVSACKELVNLALSRGSLDDITVMIIDLNHFKD